MTKTISDFGDAHIGQVCERHHARLRQYFLRQLGSAPEADRCVQETIYRFFIFVRHRCWEEVSELVQVYVMWIAGVVCSEKFAERRRLADAREEDDGGESAGPGMAEGLVRAVGERLGVQ